MSEQIVDYPVRGSTGGPRGHNESTAALGHFPLLSWRAIWAGFFISLLVSAILLCLGLGVGGTTLATAAMGQGGSGFGIGTGLWFLITALIALFLGAYYAARVSNFITSRIGASQGIVIAALFFGIIIIELSLGLGMAVRGAGATANFLGVGAADLTHSPEVQRVIAEAIGTDKLKSDPQTVIDGIAARLVAGDQAGARDYLAYQAGISKTDADTRIAELMTSFDQGMRNAAMAAARSVSAVGWTLFFTLFLGTVFAAFGGALGARNNLHKPLAKELTQPLPPLSPAYPS